MVKKEKVKIFDKEFLVNSGIAAGISFLTGVLVVEQWTWTILAAMIASAGLVFLNKCYDKINGKKSNRFIFI